MFKITGVEFPHLKDIRPLEVHISGGGKSQRKERNTSAFLCQCISLAKKVRLGFHCLKIELYRIAPASNRMLTPDICVAIGKTSAKKYTRSDQLASFTAT
jgi:hypothetical protein